MENYNNLNPETDTTSITSFQKMLNESYYRGVRRGFRKGFLRGFRYGEKDAWFKDLDEFIKEQFNHYLRTDND